MWMVDPERSGPIKNLDFSDNTIGREVYPSSLDMKIHLQKSMKEHCRPIIKEEVIQEQYLYFQRDREGCHQYYE